MMLLVSAAVLAAAAQVADPVPIPAYVGGRTVVEKSGGLRFGWPGVYFEGRFRGSAVEVLAESDTEFMRVTIDGEEKAVLKRSGAVRLEFRGLPAGEHVVRLEKQTESQTGGGRFFGFRALDGGSALPAAPRPRQIEFIGDSYTVGYGNTSPGRQCTSQEVHDRTDTQLAFGPLLAKRLGADYQVIAYSGFGIARNYNGGSPAENLPSLYPRLMPDDKGSILTRVEGWRPQIIVINLGTNDFSTPLRAGERWRDDAALRADYRRRYLAFARELLAKQPQARLILMGSDPFFGEVRQVAEAVNRGGRPRAQVVRFGGLELTGCDWHPSLEDHRRLAASLETVIAAEPKFWSDGARR